MRMSALRRFVAAVMVLALVAGWQAVAMPEAAASSAPILVATAFGTGAPCPGDSTDCGRRTMTSGECVAVCGSFQCLADLGVDLAYLPTADSWTWLTQSLSTGSVKPDHLPPRS
jgi:hypothetical protein